LIAKYGVRVGFSVALTYNSAFATELRCPDFTGTYVVHGAAGRASASGFTLNNGTGNARLDPLAGGNAHQWKVVPLDGGWINGLIAIDSNNCKEISFSNNTTWKMGQ
jgi:hypothetical protein